MTLPIDPDVANAIQVAIIAAGWSPAAAAAAIAAINDGTPQGAQPGWTPVGAALAALTSMDGAYPSAAAGTGQPLNAVVGLVGSSSPPGNQDD